MKLKWKCKETPECRYHTNSNMHVIEHSMRIHGRVFSVEKIMSVHCADSKFKDSIINLARQME